MANRECNVTKRVQTPRGLRYCRVVLATNGRIKPDLVLLGGKEEKHPEGAYYLEWREGTKRIRLSVGKDATEASAQRLRKEAELNALANGIPLATVTESNGRRTVSKAITDYLAEVKLTKKPKTLAAYTTALDYFKQSCQRTHLEDITRTDMLRFAAFLRDEKGLEPRTCWNKFSNVMSFLKACEIRVKMKKTDWPRFTEEEPEVYEREDLDKLFEACGADERLWFEFFLMTGMREQEVMYLYWSDVNLKASTVKVTHKPDRGWTPKAYKEREIPIPARLVEGLRGWKARCNRSCELVFPTAGCNPKLDFLDCVKAVAERAELNKENFWLHKFRATFATWHLWAGVDLRTVQQWLGHSDMESTMRYLKPSRDKKVHQKVNETFA